MTTITFPRPTRALLSMNDRHHWRRKAADVKAWRQATCMHARGHAYGYSWRGIVPKPFPPSMVCVTLDVADNRRRDPMNYMATVKPLIDGLVDAGWWPDDTPEWVTVVEPVLRVVGHKTLNVTVELVPR